MQFKLFMKSIHYAQALKIAENWVDTLYGREMYPNTVVVKPYGWIFKFATVEYMNSSDSAFELYGNIPFMVLKDGRIITIPWPLTIEKFIFTWESLSESAKEELASKSSKATP